MKRGKTLNSFLVFKYRLKVIIPIYTESERYLQTSDSGIVISGFSLALNTITL
jgi:hypothetical protein